MALTEAGFISLASAILTAATLIVVALIGRGAQKGRRQARAARAELKEAVQAENGHPTLGAGLAAVEERLIEGEKHFDRLDTKVSESLALTADTRQDVRVVADRLQQHLDDVDPLMRWAIEQSGIEIPTKEELDG